MITQNLHNFSRRLLQNPNLFPPPPPATQSPATLHGGGDNTFDANVVMVLSVLLCALICSLGLNSIVRCALRCSALVAAATSSSPATTDRRSVASAAATGVKKKALRTFPTVAYTSPEQLGVPGLDGECAICLSEFVAGDKLRLLPKCCHGFHVRCIDTWLNSHSSCPKCRHNLLDTCHKIVGRAAGSPESFPAPVVVVDMSPLEHEGPVRNYRGASN